MPPNEMGLEILRLLKIRWDMAGEGGKPSVVSLDELSEHFGLPREEMREQCSLVEKPGYVRGIHAPGGEPNPGYVITHWGRRYVVDNS